MDKTYTVIKGERGSGRIFHLERALSVKSAQLAAANKEVSRLEETNVSLQNTISILMCEVERLNEAQQWIPVTERLPESEGMYLCIWRYANEDETKIDVLRWDGERFPWEDFCWHGQHIVTHWMPLPQPPKEEK